MNIILSNAVDREIREKYIVLELDTFRVADMEPPVKSWALVSADNLPLEQLGKIEHFTDLHDNLIRNYRLRNWKYCEDAIEHLVTFWNGDLKSFYQDLYARIQTNKAQQLHDDWDYHLIKS